MIQILGRPGTRLIGLGLLALVMLLMPVSYRAGTGTSHAHSILQGVVDTAVGHPHHHREETGTATSRRIVSPFVPANVPLDSWATGHMGGAGSALSSGQPASPDMPERMGLYSPIEPSSPIQELGALIALLLANAAGAPLWESVTRLLQVSIVQDPPPPRPAS